MKMKAAVIREMGAKQPYAESKPMKIEEVEIGAPQEKMNPIPIVTLNISFIIVVITS